MLAMKAAQLETISISNSRSALIVSTFKTLNLQAHQLVALLAQFARALLRQILWQVSRLHPQQRSKTWNVDLEKHVIYAKPHRLLKGLTIDSMQRIR